MTKITQKKLFFLTNMRFHVWRIIWLLKFPPAANRQVPSINSHTKAQNTTPCGKKIYSLKTNIHVMLCLSFSLSTIHDRTTSMCQQCQCKHYKHLHKRSVSASTQSRARPSFQTFSTSVFFLLCAATVRAPWLCAGARQWLGLYTRISFLFPIFAHHPW